MMEPWEFKNDDAESHENLQRLPKGIKASSSNLQGEDAKAGKAVLEIMAPVENKFTKQLADARDEVQEKVDLIKSYCRPQDENRYESKVDVLKVIWAELPRSRARRCRRSTGNLLVELEEKSAAVEGESKHS